MASYTTTNAPLPWMEPYLQDYMGRAQDVANQGYTASPNTYTAPNQYLQSGWNAVANRAMQGSQVLNDASQALTNNFSAAPMTAASTGGAGEGMNPYATQTNKFMGVNNPYLSDTIANAQKDLVSSYNMIERPQWDKAMAGSGSFGNSGVSEYQNRAQNDLTTQLGRIGLDARMGAYNQSANLMENQLNRQTSAGESQLGRQFQGAQSAAQRADNAALAGRQLQMQAIGMAPQFAQQDYNDANALLNVGNQMQTYDQGRADQNYRWWQEAQNFPRQQMGTYGQALGVGNTGSTQTQTQPDPSTAAQLLGGGLTGAAIYKMLFPGG
jgi:hypothetical protein